MFLGLWSGCGLYSNSGNFDSTLAEQAQSVKESSGSSGSRRYTSRRRSSSRDRDSDNDDDDDPDPAALLHRLTSNGLSVKEFLKTSVFLYTLIGRCNSSSDEAVHKACVRACLRAGTSVQTCIGNCDSANSDACGTGSSVCSGVFQAKDHILTNHHCIREEIGGYTNTDDNKHYYSIAGTIIENSSGQKTSLDNIKWYDTTDDIALVELSDSLSRAVVPDFGSVSNLHLLDELFTIGAPKGIKWTASLGRLTNKSPPSNLCRNCIAYSIPIGEGNSGGPVFDTEGHLVALISSSLIGYDNVNFGPHIDRIKHLINRNGSGDVKTLSKIDRETVQFLNSENTLENIKNLTIYLWNL